MAVKQGLVFPATLCRNLIELFVSPHIFERRSSVDWEGTVRVNNPMGFDHDPFLTLQLFDQVRNPSSAETGSDRGRTHTRGRS